MELYATVDNNNIENILALEIDIFSTNISSAVTLNGISCTRYKVARPSSSSKSGLTDDGKNVIIKIGSETTDDFTVPINMLLKNLKLLGFNTSSRTLRKSVNVDNDNFLRGPDMIDLDMNVPLSFKRANTVVNLGRL